MSSFRPEVHEYVEEVIFAYLQSIPKSKDMEDRYRSLTSQVKSASTAELHRIAKKCSSHILANTDNLKDLSDLEDDELIHEALAQAIEGNDQGD